MTVLIVGGDRLGNIPKELQKEGFTEIIHWTGRSKSCRTRDLPRSVDRVILLYDFTSHLVMQNVKKQAKMYKIPITYHKRALVGLAV